MRSYEDWRVENVVERAQGQGFPGHAVGGCVRVVAGDCAGGSCWAGHDGDAGADCDGQIVVTDDILGKFTDFAPKFVKKFANLHDIMLDSVRQYSKEVKDLEFPSKKESFELQEEER